MDPVRAERLEAAIRASREFLRAAVEPTASPADRLAATERLLDRYFTHVDGCDAANSYCDAPEEKYQKAAGCNFVGFSGRATGGTWALALAVGCFVLGRRRRPLAATPLGLLLLSAPARAAEPTPAPPPAAVTPPAATTYPGMPERDGHWGMVFTLAGSVENPAAAAALGVRYRIGQNFSLGLDAEYNPWLAPSTATVRSGVVSAYAVLLLRFPMPMKQIALRSLLQLGASRMMFDLYGVPEGSVGPYVGFNLLGIEYRTSQNFAFTLDPAHVAIPIPQASGVPYANPQYRITFGIQWGG